ncbi:uncharacterized protein LOC122640024 [Telopea speciosissima]|uniref:uncharacterized protein LOC122640024 n=1 Tax=Telopea speciosissima TaxID=54955 RepID=UPI001CC62A5E|nr:uncharacterized protein LOC122640024 [Telopea speciosissima]
MIYSIFHKAIHGGSGQELDDDKNSTMKKKKSEMPSQQSGRFQDSSGASGEKRSDEPTTNKSATQCTVMCVYLTKIAGMCRNVTVTWCKNLINHSLNISVDNPGDKETNYTCKIDLKPWHFWSKKGFKSFTVSGKRVDVFWDLRSAKFSGSPEPNGDYYVALVSDEEVVLLLGDSKKEAYKRTKSRPSLIDAVLICKKENVFGKKCFSTRAKFDERKKEHDIVVENSITGPRDPEMWISIDGIVLIHVRNLQWKFRGNETVIVNKTPVQVFWDVHDWLFSSNGLGHGVFIFKPGAPEYRIDQDFKDGSSSVCSGDSNSGSAYFSTQSVPTSPDFCLFLYAWKLE